MSKNGWGGLATRFAIGFAVCGLAIYFVTLNHPQTEKIAAGVVAFGGGDVDQTRVLYISEGDIAFGFFREPFETAVFIFNDLRFMAFSTHESNRVGVGVEQLLDRLNQSGRDVKECLFAVHNHFTPSSFTDSDKRTYYDLKELGFRGVFAIYHTATGEIETIKE